MPTEPTDWIRAAVAERIAALGWSAREVARRVQAAGGTVDHRQVQRYLADPPRQLTAEKLGQVLAAIGLGIRAEKRIPKISPGVT